MNKLFLDAAVYAARCHSEQRRKYTGEPYINHPLEVASIVASVEHDEEMLVAAMLHDVVEDCGVKIEDIEKDFGPTVSAYVDALTDCPKTLGNRNFRKAIDAHRLSNAHPMIQTVKLADLISNTSSIIAHDPKFAKVYLAEKRTLLSVMRKGSPTLHLRASQMVTEGLLYLEGIAA